MESQPAEKIAHISRNSHCWVPAARAFLTDFLQRVGSVTPSNFAKTVAMEVHREAKHVFHEFGEECEGQAQTSENLRLELKLATMFWMVDLADDVVRSFAYFRFVPRTTCCDAPPTRILSHLKL